VFSWPLINQAVAMAGGVLVAGTVVALAARSGRASRSIRLAVVPATLVSIAVTSGGLGTLAGTGELLDGFDAEPWLVIPHLLWLVWGVALGAATCAYWLRRRARCARCGRS
jgi:hypothetical protein